MIQGTTPTLLIYIDGFDLGQVSEVVITLSQPKVQIDKKLSAGFVEVNAVEGFVMTTLTQTDSLQLMLCDLVRIQVKILDNSNNVLASNIITSKVEEILNKEVLE